MDVPLGEELLKTLPGAETVAQVREHWKGPFHFGAPDGIVANLTPDKVWVRGKNATNNATIDFFFGIHEYEA